MSNKNKLSSHNDAAIISPVYMLQVISWLEVYIGQNCTFKLNWLYTAHLPDSRKPSAHEHGKHSVKRRLFDEQSILSPALTGQDRECNPKEQNDLIQCYATLSSGAGAISHQCADFLLRQPGQKRRSHGNVYRAGKIQTRRIFSAGYGSNAVF